MYSSKVKLITLRLDLERKNAAQGWRKRANKQTSENAKMELKERGR